mmetsp:Transcript_1853/g.5431  ORF Transcript_1853/g.5431 Transcript_1853/m.5431 type:complete len:263 (-) Transcript_1853:1462-2250(-)
MLARIIGHQNFSAFRGSKMLGSACVTATPMSLAMPGSTEGIEPEDAWIVLCYTQHYLAPPGRKDVTLETALDTSPGECPFPAWSAPPLACPWPRASCSIFLSSPISALRPFSSSRTPSTRSSSPLSSELFTDASRVHSLPSRFLFLFTSVLAFRKWMYCGYLSTQPYPISAFPPVRISTAFYDWPRLLRGVKSASNSPALHWMQLQVYRRGNSARSSISVTERSDKARRKTPAVLLEPAWEGRLQLIDELCLGTQELGAVIV